MLHAFHKLAGIASKNPRISVWALGSTIGETAHYSERPYQSSWLNPHPCNKAFHHPGIGELAPDLSLNDRTLNTYLSLNWSQQVIV